MLCFFLGFLMFLFNSTTERVELCSRNCLPFRGTCVDEIHVLYLRSYVLLFVILSSSFGNMFSIFWLTIFKMFFFNWYLLYSSYVSKLNYHLKIINTLHRIWKRSYSYKAKKYKWIALTNMSNIKLLTKVSCYLQTFLLSQIAYRK